MTTKSSSIEVSLLIVKLPSLIDARLLKALFPRHCSSKNGNLEPGWKAQRERHVLRQFLLVGLLLLSNVKAGAKTVDGFERTQYIYVAPDGSGSGSGSEDSPFILKQGGEYKLSGLIKASSDLSSNVVVTFDDGVYKGIRLKIIRQGIDSESVYSDDTIESVSCRNNNSAQPEKCNCNSAGLNCRLHSHDYTLGSNSQVRLTLQAKHRGAVIFDGNSLSVDTKDATALTIGGSHFGVQPSAISNLRSHPMSNVIVDGLTIVNYRNGILVDFSSDVLITRCRLENIGSGPSASILKQNYGAFAFGLNGNSTRIAFVDNDVDNSRDIAPGDPQEAPLPSLMHSIYLQNSRDILFSRNRIVGSSGPMVKFSNFSGDGVIPEYSPGPGGRRSFFVNNLFRLTTVFNGQHPLKVFSGQQSFIEDNSVVATKFGVSSPAAGVIFASNSFVNELPSKESKGKVSLLRQELPERVALPSFPQWQFLGNDVKGISDRNLLVFRRRGLPLTIETIESGLDISKELVHYLFRANQSVMSTDEITREIVRLIGVSLQSNYKSEDESAIAFVEGNLR